MSANYQLIDADANATDLTVVLPGVRGAYHIATSGVLDASNANRVNVVGDATETVAALTVTVKLINLNDEPAGWVALHNLRVACINAVTLKRIATGDYRALQVGGAFARLAPKPVGHRLDAWLVEATLLPLYPRWTTTDARTLTAYKAAVKA